MGEIKNRIKTELLHFVNYWILGMWFILRFLDYVFSFVAISSGIGYEINPIGFNLILLVVGFVPIFTLLIINYKFPKMRVAMFFIFLIVSALTIIQTVATLNSIFVVIIFS